MKAPQLRTLNSRFTRAKATLLRRLTSEFGDVLSPAMIRRAFLEAEQTAANTGFPHLLFPVLAEENVRRVSAVLAGDFDTARPLESIAA